MNNPVSLNEKAQLANINRSTNKSSFKLQSICRVQMKCCLLASFKEHFQKPKLIPQHLSKEEYNNYEPFYQIIFR